MTLLVGIHTKHGSVVASDSKLTAGYYFEGFKKLHVVGQHCVLFAGSVSHLAPLLNAHQQTLGNFHNVEDLVTGLVGLINQINASWPNDQGPVPDLGFMIAGRDRNRQRALFVTVKSQNGYQALRLDPFATQGSNVAYCMGYAALCRYYSQDITLEKAKELAAYILVEAAAVDNSVGGAIHMATILV